MPSYEEFLAAKARKVIPTGFTVDPKHLPSQLFPFQADIVRWALNKGRAAIFAGTGLGKTGMQLSWAKPVAPREATIFDNAADSGG